MIRPASGDTVHELLDRAARVPGRYREIVVSAPFLDDRGRDLLQRVEKGAGAAGRRLVLAVPKGTSSYRELDASSGALRVKEVPRLHAKVYALLGMDPGDSEAIVTSANLTASGLFRNREVGIHLRGCDTRVQRVIEQVAARVHH